MKRNIFLCLMMFIILSLSMVSYGASETVTATINKEVCIIYNGEIKSFADVNGGKVYPVSYNWTTYLPIRAMSSLFEIPVWWDGANNKIYLDSGELVASTVSTVQTFEKGISESDSFLLNRDIQIEYKEKVRTFTDANGNVVYPLSYNGTTYLPVRAISNLYGAEIDWIGETNEITIERKNEIAKITNVTIKVIDDVICAVVTTDTPLYDYKYFSLSEPTCRIILDLENSEFAITRDTLAIDYDVLDQVRFGIQENNVNRIVLDVNKIDTYTVVQSEDRRTTYLALSSTFDLVANEQEDDDTVLVASIGDKIYVPVDNKKEDDEDTTNATEDEDITNAEKENNEEVSGEESKDVESGETTDEEDKLSEEEIEKLPIVTSITYSSSTDKTKIKVQGNYEYDAFKLSDPPRVVVDIKGVRLEDDLDNEITPNNKNIKSIRYAQNEQDVVRVVFDLDEEAEYEITERSLYLEVELEEPSSNNVEYEEYEDYAILRLTNAKKRTFSTSTISSSNKFVMNFSSTKFEAKSKTLEIDDDFVEEIIIKSSKITIYGTGEMEYEMTQDDDDVIVTISKEKKSSDDFVVLIDAGHGGSDPGACNGSDYEKVYTLKVMLKLKEMLEDTEGIEVRASRTKDVYIDREGRLDFVLDNPDADLVTSIHINALSNKNYQGTMVLFYNKPGEERDYGITSKELATLVKNNLVDELDLIDRGVVSREDLWILEQNAAGIVSEITGEDRPVTNVPAILCELCFISNDEELERLKTDEFQEGAAKAIYEGIMEAKEQMEK